MLSVTNSDSSHDQGRILGVRIGRVFGLGLRIGRAILDKSYHS